MTDLILIGILGYAGYTIYNEYKEQQLSTIRPAHEVANPLKPVEQPQIPITAQSGSDYTPPSFKLPAIPAKQHTYAYR